MREHPIPQDITGYKFHLIGDMTLKQFAELVVGAVGGFLIYQTNLPGFLKWPMIGLSGLLGVAMAFVPFEERPLDHWVITFFKVLYKPTKFYWKREPKIPDAFNYEADASRPDIEPEVDLSPARRERIKEFMVSIRRNTSSQDAWDRGWQQQVDQVLQSFDQVVVPPSLVTPAAQTTPQYQNEIGEADSSSFDQNKLLKKEKVVDQPLKSQHPKKLPAKPNLKVRVRKLKAQSMQPTDSQQNEQQLLSNKPADESTSAGVGVDSNKAGFFKNKPQDHTSSSAQTQTANINQSLPFPNKPNQPNKLVGMVITPQGELVDQAIVEIKDRVGQIVRAVKSNSLGQFFISTPLSSGTYTIEVEKQSLNFPPYKIELVGKAVDPLEIRAEVN